MRFRLVTANRFMILVVLVYLLGTVGHALLLKKTVYGDGRYYYSTLHALGTRWTLDTTPEFLQLGVTERTTLSGYPANKYSLGPALFWLPTFLSIHRLYRGTGYELPYQLGVALTSTFAALFGLLILFRWASKTYGTRAAGWSTLAIAGASNLLFYGSVDTVNSHAITFFFASVLLTMAAEKPRLIQGLSLGFLALTRPQDIIHFALIFSRKYPISGILRTGIVIFTLLSIQLFANRVIYGQWIVSGYFISNEGFFADNAIHIFDVLFSPKFGLFTATPIVLLSLFGIRHAIRKDKRLVITTLIVAFFQIAAVTFWSTWSQGASYGGRMFVSLLPIVAWWLAALFNTAQKTLWRGNDLIFLLIASLSILNALRIVWFLLVSP